MASATGVAATSATATATESKHPPCVDVLAASTAEMLERVFLHPAITTAGSGSSRTTAGHSSSSLSGAATETAASTGLQQQKTGATSSALMEHLKQSQHDAVLHLQLARERMGRLHEAAARMEKAAAAAPQYAKKLHTMQQQIQRISALASGIRADAAVIEHASGLEPRREEVE